jgi:hypothetical protein
MQQKQTSSVALVRELYRPSFRRLLAKLVPTFADRKCCVVSITDSYGRNLNFYNTAATFSFKELLSCTHEAEWTQFQTYNFS